MQICRKAPFTLIELLIVVAVIAVLAALLLPALSQAKESARQAMCLSHQKQCYLALQLYADDHSGAILTSWTCEDGRIIHWPTFVTGLQGDKGAGATRPPVNGANYIEPSAVFGCPSSPKFSRHMDNYGRTNIAYGIFKTGTWDLEHRYKWDFDTHHKMYPVNAGGRPFCRVQVLSRVPDPGSILMLADSYSSRDWWQEGPGRVMGAFNPLGNSDWSTRIGLLHRDRANACAYDGHAEVQEVRQLNTGIMQATRFFTRTGVSIEL